jgi:hypothetical protein
MQPISIIFSDKRRFLSVNKNAILLGYGIICVDLSIEL